MSRGGAAYRPETLRHTRGNWLTKSRFAERYPQDAAPTAAGGQQVAPTGSKARRTTRGGKGRATGLRPADRPTLVSITRGLWPQPSRSAREEVRGEREPKDQRDDGEEEKDEPRNRDERGHLAFPRLLDLMQVFRFLFEPFDGVAQPGKRPPIEGAGVVCCVPTLRHGSMVRER